MDNMQFYLLDLLDNVLAQLANLGEFEASEFKTETQDELLELAENTLDELSIWVGDMQNSTEVYN